MRNVRTVIMAGPLLGLAMLPLTLAVAEARQDAAKSSKAARKAAKPTVGGDAEASLDKARRALDEGQAGTAQQLADAVLISGRKEPRSTARALAIRGEAYLQQGRPAEAMADLESALWLKGGLEGRERELATSARNRAMQTGGIAGGAPPAPSPLPRASELIAAAPSAPPAPAAPPPQRWSAAATPSRPARQPPASEPSAWSSAVTTAPVAQQPRPVPQAPTSAPSDWSTAREPAPQPVESASTSEGTSGLGGITGFFSGLFGGGQSSTPASEATTGSLTSSSTPRAPMVSSYEPQRAIPEARVARTPPPRAAPVRAATMVAPADPAPASVPVTEGVYRLQLAAVRTKSEAEAMAQKVRTQEARLVGSRTFEIVEDVYGNMGRFYRVRIGSFSEATQALSVCASLRDRHVDCMVLDR